ncbi:ADP-ribosylglycohydrolase family protein [Micrococcaceae bacterium Sec6.3]
MSEQTSGQAPTPAAAPALPADEHARRVLALLAAGAAGDALGGVVEFTPASGITAQLGPSGVTDAVTLMALDGARSLPITDDTQMTLYVLDGLLEWIEWQNAGQASDAAACVWLACLRWYATQRGSLPEGAPPVPGRWIDEHEELRVQQAPGNACLSGLADPGMGLPGDPHNPESKGCGTVMRSAPYGMVPGLEDHHVASFARQGAVLTHGHPTAWVSAATHALVIAALLRGATLPDAVAHARAWVEDAGEDGLETAAALEAAERLAQAASRDDGDLGAPGSLPLALGEGWVAEEALAIAVFAALVADRVADGPEAALALALRIGVNHGGDSDSTASLAGQLLGARHGLAVFGAEADVDPASDAAAACVPAWIAERGVVIEAARRWSAATT